jgi:osmoprotectant transport system substrate-binding protein
MALLFLGSAGLIGAFGTGTSLASSSPTKAATGSIKIGQKNFAEEEIIAAMYQLLLQKAGFSVSLHTIAETPALQSALQRGDIDLYPEYTGTGLIYMNHAGIVTDAVKAYDIVKAAYPTKYKETWLAQAPMNDTNGVAVTRATASKYHLSTLSDLARVSRQLTFADDPACKGRPDCLAGMQQAYGIHFKSVTDISSTPLRYSGLASGKFNAVECFTTDAPIEANHLVVLKDNKGKVFPADHIAPLVRNATLSKYPQIRRTLNKLAQYLTTPVMINLNGKVILKSKDPSAVARAFLKSKGLL